MVSLLQGQIDEIIEPARYDPLVRQRSLEDLWEAESQMHGALPLSEG